MLRTSWYGFVLLLAFAPLIHAEEVIYDLVVYGGTSSGVAAAVQAKRMGKSAIVIEPGKHLGGLTSGGLGMTDSGNKAVIGGIAREFYQRVKKHYDQPSSWKYEQRAGSSLYHPAEDAMWTFEPHVAEMIFEQLVVEHDVAVVRRQRLNRESGVRMNGQHITSITMESGDVYRGRMFIDATYEGDLMAAGGVTYTVGRESNSAYGETLNGVQKRENTHNHRFIVNVDPYVMPADPASGLLPGIHGDPPGEEGDGDDRVQAYCFRMCMSNVASNRVPFPKPADYDQRRFELLLRTLEAGDLRFPMHPAMMPNGKTDTNNSGAFSTDNIGMNYDYPDASYERRAAIIAEHETYQKGFMWTLANHPRVPQKIRDEMAQWGLAADEFVETGNWPHQLYIREARRMVSDYVVTELDCRRTRVAEDPVGMGSYNMDSHNVQRYVSAEGFAKNEGDVQVSPGGAYSIGYRSLVPKQGQCENLLVPVCLSSSHIAYGSIRMEPVFMILGQSAATAAVLAINDGVSVQQLDYARLRARMIADGQVLEWTQPPARKAISIDPKSLPGVILDDEVLEQTGAWVSSTSSDRFIGARYWHDQNEGQGAKFIHFRHSPDVDGRYEIRLAYTAHRNRATNVPVFVSVGTKVTTVVIDQSKEPPIDGAFISLGKFGLVANQEVTVTISNAGANGYVVVDAVQILHIRERSAVPRQGRATGARRLDPGHTRHVSDTPIAANSSFVERRRTIYQQGGSIWNFLLPPESTQQSSMGIQDRQYYRDDEMAHGGFDASGTTMITKIIAVTVAAYFLDLFIGGRGHWLMDGMASSADDLMRPWYWWRFLTSGFAHSPNDIRHILYNMAGLFFLGRTVETVYGQKEILRFYLIAIVLGSVGQAVHEYVANPAGPWAGCYGASGAVTAVIVLFICNFPKQMLLLFFVIPVPAWVVGILIIVLNVAGANGIGDSHVAYDVHLIGAAFAFAYFKFKWNFARFVPRNFADVAKSLKPKPQFRVHHPDEHDSGSDEEGDALLEKVNQHGIESLTSRERKILEDYSRRMRQKHR